MMNNAPPVNQEFDTARNQAEHDRHRQQVFDDIQTTHKVDAGVIDENQVSRPIKSALLSKDENGNPKHKNKDKIADKVLFKTLLKNIEKQLAEIQQQMDELYEMLRAKYGDDVVGGIAATHLPPEVLDKLKTDEDKMRALAKLMLNPDGTIKDKYKDSVDAQYIQAWQQAQQLIDKRMNLYTSESPTAQQTTNEELEDTRDTALIEKQTFGYSFT